MTAVICEIFIFMTFSGPLETFTYSILERGPEGYINSKFLIFGRDIYVFLSDFDVFLFFQLMDM